MMSSVAGARSRDSASSRSAWRFLSASAATLSSRKRLTGGAFARTRRVEHGRVDDVRDDPVATARLDLPELAEQALADRAHEVGCAEAVPGQQPVHTAHEAALEGGEVLAHDDRAVQAPAQQHRREAGLEHVGVDHVGRQPARLQSFSTASIPTSCVAIAGGPQARAAIDQAARREWLGWVVPIPEHSAPRHGLRGQTPSTRTSLRSAAARACSRQNSPNTGRSGHGYHFGMIRTRRLTGALHFDP